MKVEDRPPEPEAEEAAARVPLDQRLRGFALQLLAPAVSLLLAAVLGVLVILIVQQDWADVVDVADAMWSYGLFNRNSLAFILGRATPLIFAGLAVAIAFRIMALLRMPDGSAARGLVPSTRSSKPNRVRRTVSE
jgi:hypothetical protein